MPKVRTKTQKATGASRKGAIRSKTQKATATSIKDAMINYANSPAGKRELERMKLASKTMKARFRSARNVRIELLTQPMTY